MLLDVKAAVLYIIVEYLAACCHLRLRAGILDMTATVCLRLLHQHFRMHTHLEESAVPWLAAAMA